MRTHGPLVLVAALAASGCSSMIEVPVDTPLQSKLDVSGFRRILIAGFVTDLED
jgi:nicotinamidase-related amidase